MTTSSGERGRPSPLSARVSYEYGWETSPGDVELSVTTEVRTASASGGRLGEAGLRHEPPARADRLPTWACLRSAVPEAITRTCSPSLRPQLTTSRWLSQSPLMKTPTRSSGTRYHRDPLVDAIARCSGSRVAGPRPRLEPLERGGSPGSGRRPRSRRSRGRSPRDPPDARLSTRRRTRRRQPTRRSWLRSARRRPRPRRSPRGFGRCGPDVAVRRGGATRAVAAVSARKGIASQFTPEPSSRPHDSTSEAAKSETASTAPRPPTASAPRRGPGRIGRTRGRSPRRRAP